MGYRLSSDSTASHHKCEGNRIQQGLGRGIQTLYVSCLHSVFIIIVCECAQLYGTMHAC